MNITLYFCGWDLCSAKAGTLFEGKDEAEDYAKDNDMNIFEVKAVVDWSTAKVVR